MSSWRSGSKFPNLQQVGDFSILGSKSVTFYRRFFAFLKTRRCLQQAGVYFRFQKFHFFTKDFKKEFWIWCQVTVFWFFSEFSHKVHFLGGWEAYNLSFGGGFLFDFFFVNSAVKVHFLVWWDGMDGWDGHQKCPLKIFILCKNIEKVFTYIYTKIKLSPTLL